MASPSELTSRDQRNRFEALQVEVRALERELESLQSQLAAATLIALAAAERREVAEKNVHAPLVRRPAPFDISPGTVVWMVVMGGLLALVVSQCP